MQPRERPALAPGWIAINAESWRARSVAAQVLRATRRRKRKRRRRLGDVTSDRSDHLTRGTSAGVFIEAASAPQPRRQTLPQSLVTGKCDVQLFELGLPDDEERSVPARRGARRTVTPSAARHRAGSGGGACNRARAAAAMASAPRSAMASRQAPLAPPRPAKAPES